MCSQFLGAPRCIERIGGEGIKIQPSHVAEAFVNRLQHERCLWARGYRRVSERLVRSVGAARVYPDAVCCRLPRYQYSQRVTEIKTKLDSRAGFAQRCTEPSRVEVTTADACVYQAVEGPDGGRGRGCLPQAGQSVTHKRPTRGNKI